MVAWTTYSPAEHLERLGAEPLLRHCRDELAGCGVGPRVSAGDGYGLSAREQIVARLVMAGRGQLTTVRRSERGRGVRAIPLLALARVDR